MNAHFHQLPSLAVSRSHPTPPGLFWGSLVHMLPEKAVKARSIKRSSEKNQANLLRINPSVHIQETMVLKSLMSVSWENRPEKGSLSDCPAGS